MNVKLYVDNLPKSITQGELNTLFNQAGEVTMTDLITDRNSGEVKGFAFVTMSTRSEAERAIHMFNQCSLHEHKIKVNMAKLSLQL
jgi:RNA recognition motif-containing protein